MLTVTRFGRFQRPERDQLIAVCRYQFVAVCRYQCRRDFPRIYDVLKRFDLILQRPRRIRPQNALDPVEPFQKIIRPFSRIIQIPVIERLFLILPPLCEGGLLPAAPFLEP